MRDDELLLDAATYGTAFVRVTPGGPELVTGATTSTDDLTVIYGRAFDAGLSSGRRNAGNDEIFALVTDATLACLMDETAPEHVREKSFANLIGFTEGWREAMAVPVRQFLTPYQSWCVTRLPRAIRQGWESEYRKGVKKWQKGGGTLSGRRPVFPAVPEAG